MDEENKNEISETENVEEEKNSKSSRKRVSLDKVLPDYRVTKLKDHLETIKAYYHVSNKGIKELRYTDFKGYVSFHEQKVSGLNKFFEALGLIESIKGKPGQYKPTIILLDFQKALEFNYEDKAKTILGNTLLKTWFYESVRNVLQMKGKATVNELIQKLGFDSGADPKLHNNSLKILVEYLNYTGIIIEKEGEFTLSKLEDENIPELQDEKVSKEENIKINDIKQEAQKRRYIVKESMSSNISVNINIPADIDENKLDIVFKKIKQHFFDSEKKEENK